MNNTRPLWITIALLTALLAGIAYKFLVLGSTSPGEDGRTVVELSGGERDQVLAEMRLLLEATRKITGALANEDREAIAGATRPVGSQAIGTMDFALKAKLPMEFKKLGFSTHYAFDEIGDMARDGAPLRSVQLKLAETMDNCIACHAGYRIPSPAAR